MFNTSDFGFWAIVIVSLAINVGIYYFRAKKASARQKTFLKIGAGMIQAMVFSMLIMLNFPVTYHHYDAEETSAKETARLFKMQDQQLTQIDSDLKQIQTALIGITFSLCFISIIATTELYDRETEPEPEGPILLGLNNR